MNSGHTSAISKYVRRLSEKFLLSSPLAASPSPKRISDPHAPIQSSVLKILGDNFLEPVVFGIGPDVRVEPRDPVCSRAQER